MFSRCCISTCIVVILITSSICRNALKKTSINRKNGSETKQIWLD